MNKAEMKILEGAYEAEVSGALNKTTAVFQSRSKVAKQLADEGYLQPTVEHIRCGNMPVKIEGYTLTHAGRLTYCLSCG